jgi:pilus assembly protein Flp/PilA
MMKHLKKQAQIVAKRYAQDEDGAALVEYGLLVGLIAVVCMAAVVTVGVDVQKLFNGIGNCLTDVASGAAGAPACVNLNTAAPAA